MSLPTSRVYCQLNSPTPNISSKLLHSPRWDVAETPSLPTFRVILPHFLSWCLFIQPHGFFADPQSVTHSPSLPSHHPIPFTSQNTFSLFQTSAPSTSQWYPHTFIQYLIPVRAYPECRLSFVSHKVPFSSFLLSNQGVSFSLLPARRRINQTSISQHTLPTHSSSEILLLFNMENVWEGWNPWKFNCCSAARIPVTVFQRITIYPDCHRNSTWHISERHENGQPHRVR